jgi:hypothetical protein
LPCHWRGEIDTLIEQLRTADSQSLPFGNGRSYGDSCLAASVRAVYLRPLSRFIDVDWERGEVTVEAGMTLEELLQQCVPRGWFLPVPPGTQLATVGGAISNDVHGKNHHRLGTFGHHIEHLDLVRSDKGQLRCSASHNNELFRATIGGLGLTGIIASARLRLRHIQSSQIRVRQLPFANLAEFFNLSDELDPLHEYSVAWVDCLSTGTQAGRGLLMLGEHDHAAPCQVSRRRRLNVPFTPPLPLFNRWTLKALNEAYYHLKGHGPEHQRQDYQAFFYPWIQSSTRQVDACIQPRTRTCAAMTSGWPTLPGSIWNACAIPCCSPASGNE